MATELKEATAPTDFNSKEQEALMHWSPHNAHVEQHVQEGVSVGSGDILICVGPSRLKNIISPTTGTAQVNAIGTVGSISVTQQKPVKVVYEIGSKIHYNISTNASGSIALSRVFLNDQSLMKALYSFKPQADLVAATSGPDKPGGLKDPLWINMAASLFEDPFGLLLWVKDNKKNNIGAYYFENCMAQGHSFALYATGTAFTESTNIIFDRAVPVAMPADEYAVRVTV